jgi:L-fucose isomerase-like protein
MNALFVVLSELEHRVTIEKRVRDTVKTFDIVEFLDSILVAEQAVTKYHAALSGATILVASGGTEAIINQVIYQLAKPTLLWATPENNSLPAALEAYAALKERFPIKIHYAPLESPSATMEIQSFNRVCDAIEQVDHGTIACIGAPSPWLLTSHGIKAFQNFTTAILKLRLHELLERADQMNDAAAEAAHTRLSDTIPCSSVAPKDVLQSIRLYLAMKAMATEYGLAALTIRCFDLIPRGRTACLAVSLCNDDGIVAGCEGDLEATLSMLLASRLLNQPSWMANPSQLDRDRNTLTLAHCTVPTTMLSDPEQACLSAHMESGVPTAIEGRLKEQTVTLLRLGGSLGRLLMAVGTVLKSDADDSLCRTQAVVQLEGDVITWLENAPGNHHVLVYGDARDALFDLCRFKRITPVVI